MTIGLLPLGRPTFDVDFANEQLTALLNRLDESGRTFVGPRSLLFDAEETLAAIEDLKQAGITSLLILQVTFTDASMTVEAAKAFDMPMAIWAVPEPRIGGRLRLNAFCGLNLASHALGLQSKQFSWLYADPTKVSNEDVMSLLDGQLLSGHIEGQTVGDAKGRGNEIVRAVKGRKIGRIGEHPVGFDTCAYSPKNLEKLAGVTVDEIDLDLLFETARSAESEAIKEIHQTATMQMSGLDAVDQGELNRSLALKTALSSMQHDTGYDAFAIRCWPETFTQYGGAVCGAVSMMGEAKVPCACEADVYGALTQMILQEAAQAPVFLTDLVDVDIEDDSAVVWHCGQAPISMCSPSTQAEATIHTNRKMPLLYQFVLKPGRVTLMRISQAFGKTQMVISGAEMLDEPMAFTGTSGTLRFDTGAEEALKSLVASGLEHHMALAYGDHRATLKSVAAAMDIPALEI